MPYSITDKVREIFAPITKMYDGPDGFFVEGVMVAEEPDRVREIWDYASSKKSMLEWAQDFAAKTQGRSVGNLRAMHGSTAAGKFTMIEPNDGEKLFYGRAEVVDEAEKEKCRKGVYTGFSLKAPYARKWTDPHDPKYTRWTSGPIIETSLVDMPCVRSATFSMKVTSADRMQEFESVHRFAHYQNDQDIDALADLVAEKLERGTKTQTEEEIDMLTLKEINEKYAALKAQFDEFGTALTAPAEKCMKAAGDCTDPNCAEHGKATKAAKDALAAKAAADAAAASKVVTLGDGAKMVSIGKTADGVEVFKRVEGSDGAVKAADIRAILKEELASGLDTAVATKMAPIEDAMATLTASIARLSGVAIPTAVSLRDSTTVAAKVTDGSDDATKAVGSDGKEDAAKIAKEGKPVDGIAAIHRNGPSMVLTNRGMVGAERN